MSTSGDVRSFAESYAAEKGWKVLDVVCWSMRRRTCRFAHALFYTGNGYKVYIMRPDWENRINAILVASIPESVVEYICRSVDRYGEEHLTCWCVTANGKELCTPDLPRVIKFLAREGYISVRVRVGSRAYAVIANAIYTIAREVKASECPCN